MGLQPFPIFAPKHGLKNDVKPVFLPDDAWAKLENAYTWRERVLKREGLKFLGRLRRVLTAQNLGVTPAGPPNTVIIANIFVTLGITEPNPEIEPGSLVITVAAPDAATFTDNGDGTFTTTGKGDATGSYINYVTGRVVLQFNAALVGGAAITADINYFPALPVMGIYTRDLSSINNEETIWFDEKYAYIFNGTDFQEFLPLTGTVWDSTDSDFFWCYNYRGAADNIRLFFETNFVNTATNPMRYTDGVTWTIFQPLVTATQTLFTARILIAYYGRLLALNTFEGLTAAGNPGAVNYFNRCRFSQLGDPTAVDAWQSDIFGKGGFLDAPTNEAIIGAMFIRNTLIVTFEQTTWQLRYVGEYGLPFIWERISADFGSESTFSSVLFDNHMLAAGDKALIAANANSADRIDLDIPNQIFDFKNANNGVKRVFGVRNYQKELVYWNYADAQTSTDITFPNKVLLYNYRNNTWAIFRDSVTCFGNFQYINDITWDDDTVDWDSDDVIWDDVESQSLFPSIVSGNQEGFVHFYQEDFGVQVNFPIQEEPSLSITDINLGLSPIVLTIINHNLSSGEIIYIDGLQFLDPSNNFAPLTTDLNNQFYQANFIDANTIFIAKWNNSSMQYETNFSFTPSPASYLYVGGGRVTLIPKLDAQTKDINIYQTKSLQTKLSRLDFLMTPSQNAAMTVNILPHAISLQGAVVPIWSTNMTTYLVAGFYPTVADYSWFRFYTTIASQYFRIELTYDDSLMNMQSTHSNPWTLYAINSWVRPGGKNVF